jgi:hypothetical protein
VCRKSSERLKHYPIWEGGTQVKGRGFTSVVRGQGSQTARLLLCHHFDVAAAALIRSVEDFLAQSRDAVVIENGAVIFELAECRYSLSGEHEKCVLHLWSSERNLVRRVVECQVRNDVLRLAVQKLGQSKPSKLEISRERDRRTPTAKKACRAAYQRMLQRLLERRFPGFKIAKLSTAPDLGRSFGPVYVRGLLRQGQTSVAVLGVNSAETQSSIDAALTFGILWLDACRASEAGKSVVAGLKLFAPHGCSAVLRERMAHLNPEAAKWQMYEFDERENELYRVDLADRGNLASRLVHCSDESAARERFTDAIQYVLGIMSEAEVAVLSAGEIAFRRYGLEFARARLVHEVGSARATPEIVFGLGHEERVLCDENAAAFRRLLGSVGEVRHAEGPRDHVLWRMHPERWLESLVIANVGAIDERLESSRLYSQVPAFSAADRAMIDVLTKTRQGRLAVVELKADEDIHLPLQGLDYWARVAWHQGRGEFKRFGYFPECELAAQSPLLFLVAPALHVHPATDALLRYLSPQIEWALVGIDERWRNGVRVVFRKRSAKTTTNPQTAD